MTAIDITASGASGASGTIVVTGGARGIGRAICRALAGAGYAVAINYAHSAAQADELARTIRAAGGRAAAIRADIGDPAQIPGLFAAAEAELGPLAGLVNNAGILGDRLRIDEQTPAGLAALLAVNVTGSILAAGEAVRRLSTRHGGTGGAIVNISSVAARLGGLAGLVPYAATKGAIETFTKGLAAEVAREGVRVNAVAPGLTATDMVSPEMTQYAAGDGVPMGRVGTPDEIAAAVLYLLSPAASYVTGASLTVSGGR
ncbi:oxidoreductase [Gluconacetobacter johannae DSM 13595]|uniref:SDR family oxidoreductase n=1 Tax=Gluconacetobacter johannae TaxID=112140 RepID=A0A7W4P4I5_9PROT|nr:SDR family oxidoreductase [Gluconacetobacter johannae]MBB2177266.1 SDR family oxidoreductase [Gluconacetobacter johannae]GBQ84221.1 oxidoreductase [Gluconacetobacter johannae DSM 13595]